MHELISTSHLQQLKKSFKLPEKKLQQYLTDHSKKKKKMHLLLYFSPCVYVQKNVHQQIHICPQAIKHL